MNVQTDASFDYLINQRTKLGLSKTKMAERLNKSHQTVSNYEWGYIANDIHTRKQKFEEIAKAYEIDIVELEKEYEKFSSIKQDIRNARVVALKEYFDDICKGIKGSKYLSVHNHVVNRSEKPELAALVDAALKRELNNVVSNIYDIISAYEMK